MRRFNKTTKQDQQDQQTEVTKVSKESTILRQSCCEQTKNVCTQPTVPQGKMAMESKSSFSSELWCSPPQRAVPESHTSQSQDRDPAFTPPTDPMRINSCLHQSQNLQLASVLQIGTGYPQLVPHPEAQSSFQGFVMLFHKSPRLHVLE